MTACLTSLLVTSMVRGLAASQTGVVRVSTPIRQLQAELARLRALAGEQP